VSDTSHYADVSGRVYPMSCACSRNIWGSDGEKHLTGECKLEIVRGKGDSTTDTHPVTYGARLRRATPSEARII